MQQTKVTTQLPEMAWRMFFVVVLLLQGTDYSFSFSAVVPCLRLGPQLTLGPGRSGSS